MIFFFAPAFIYLSPYFPFSTLLLLLSNSLFPRACLKNHFHKLGLAAHEKPFLDTL